MKKLHLPTQFYSDFREPTDFEWDNIRLSYSRECELRSTSGTRTYLIYIMGFLAIFILILAQNTLLKILSGILIIETLLIFFVNRRNANIMFENMESIRKGNCAVKYAEAVEPVVIGKSHIRISRMKLQLPGVDKKISVPTPIYETKYVCDNGANKAKVMLVLHGGLNRMLVIPDVTYV